MAIPEFHFKIPPRKIERVVKPIHDYKTIDRLIDHVMGNKIMSNYQISIHDTNKDGQITIDEVMEFIISVNALNVISVEPTLDPEILNYRGMTLRRGGEPKGAIGGGGGGSGGY